MINYSKRFENAYNTIRQADTFVDNGLDVTYAVDGFSVSADICLTAGLNAQAEPYIGFLLLQSPEGHASTEVFVDDFVEIQQEMDGSLGVRYLRNSADCMDTSGEFHIQDLTQSIPAHNTQTATNSAFQFIEDSVAAHMQSSQTASL